MELFQDKNSISLSQYKLIQKGLELLEMEDSCSVLTPLSPGIQLMKATNQEKKEFKDLNINYRSHTGLLNFLACRTRPDLAPAVSILSSFNIDPGINHWKQVLHSNSTDTSNCIKYFTNAIWADDLETRLLQSGSICFWKSCPVVWNTKLNALSDGVQEIQWLTYLVEELWKEKINPTEFN
ncbi:hypothetical protein VP01_10791g1, partial [Puccinia sorghi]